MNDFNTTVANYASIVFSFLDRDNFRNVVINILDDAVYAVGYTISSGNLVAEPLRPGVSTNLTYTLELYTILFWSTKTGP